MVVPQPRWQDERVVSVRREPMHAPLRAFESAAHAHAAQVLQSEPVESRWVLPLTPASWAFHLAPTPEAAPMVRPGSGFDAAGWGSIAVPLSLEAADVGARAQYTNVRYPFPLDPPHIPSEDNHVGSYQTTFRIPDAWRGRRLLLQLDGVGAAATIWVDGREVGYTQDWALPAEFDVTAAVAAGAGGGGGGGGEWHTLSVQTLRWCDGSYLEGQDQWWLSGLHRHVRLLSKPAALALLDYACSPRVDTAAAVGALPAPSPPPAPPPTPPPRGAAAWGAGPLRP